MKEDYRRLMHALKELRPEVGDKPADIARFLGISHQNLNQWRERGVAALKTADVSSRVGCSRDWLERGIGDMVTAKRPGGAPALPEPSNAVSEQTEPASVADLLERLREEIAAQPEAVKRAIAGLMVEYVTTPDEDTGRATADAILRILGPRP